MARRVLSPSSCPILRKHPPTSPHGSRAEALDYFARALPELADDEGPLVELRHDLERTRRTIVECLPD